MGPLTHEQYNNVYKFNKHYLERTPSELYRNSMKELLEGNNKYIKDLFNKKLAYHAKRKPLRFIKKSDYTGSLLATKSDNLFTIKENQICFSKNFDKKHKKT